MTSHGQATAVAVEALALAVSGLLDESAYLAAEGGARMCTELPAAVDYCLNGSRLGVDPGPHFDVRWYQAEYPDVVAAGLRPVTHFLFFGWREGRLPSPKFALVRERVGASATRIPGRVLVDLIRPDGTLEMVRCVPESKAQELSLLLSNAAGA